jgi:hypothetical protein
MSRPEALPLIFSWLPLKRRPFWHEEFFKSLVRKTGIFRAFLKKNTRWKPIDRKSGSTSCAMLPDRPMS